MSLQKPSKKDKLKNKEKEDTREKSIFSCATHDTHLKLSGPAKSSKTAPLCKSCGFKLSGNTGYLMCANSKPCYYLCSSCRVCKSNHFLGRVFSLKQFDNNPLYGKNKFNCNGCKAEKDVTAVGVLHCIPCQFTLCSECISEEELLWKQ